MKRIVFGTVAGMAFFSGLAFAGEKTTEVNVKVNLVANVNISATDLDFGDVELGQDATAESTITITAPSSLRYRIAVNGGVNPKNADNDSCERRMSDGEGNYLKYIVVSNYSNFLNINDGCLASPTFSCGGLDNCETASGSIEFNLEGSISGLDTKSLPLGSYSDTLTVTILY